MAISPPPDQTRPGAIPIPRGTYLRPRSVEVAGRPSRILDENSSRVGAWVFNSGGLLELPVGLPALSTKFIDSAAVSVPPFAGSTYKTLILQVDVQLAWVTGAQPTIQLLVGRNQWSAAGGATSQAGGANNNFVKGAAANLGPAAATTLAVGIWPFSPADIGDLQWHHPYIGAEIAFGSALTAGAARLFLAMPGSPLLLLATHAQITPGVIGDQAASWAVPGQSSPFWYPGGSELFACSSPGGLIDVRIWEVMPMRNR